VRAIHRKLLRDLGQIKGQVVAIALVIAVGVAMFIAYLSTFGSLRSTEQAYYERYRFADIFANLKRAPSSLAGRISEIPGVGEVATRVVADVTLDVEGMTEPVTGRLIGIPEHRTAMLNDIAIRKGRYFDPGRGDEVLVIEGFALAHGLEPGDTVSAVINGRKRKLEIVGIALSPEFVYTIRPGELMPDDSRFGVFWMGRKALATAFDMEGGFNDVSLGLTPDAQVEEVISRLDRLLATYGGLGALPRRLQTSAWYLDNELKQLQGFGFFIPVVFLSVAAFLLNVVLTRIVSVQREQIAALKALGYSNAEVGWHYTLWSLAIACLGGLFGVFGGRFLGRGMINLYNDYFRFPFLEYRMPQEVIGGAVVICLAAAVIGAWGAVQRAVHLPPAEAMRPEPPARYQRTLLERLGLGRFLSQPARMVLRNLSRRPLRTAASVIGIGFSGGLLIIGFFFSDSIDEVMDMQFNVVQRQDITVSFIEPRSGRSLHDIENLPGVIYAEDLRSVPVRLRAGHRSRQTAVTGVANGALLQRVINTSYEVEELPAEGLVLSNKLAEVLRVVRGDMVSMEVLEGRRSVRQVTVTGLVGEYMGMSAYMEIDALRRLMREGRNVSGVYLMVDSRLSEDLYQRLKNIPAVAGVALKQAAINAFNKQMDEMMGVFIFFNILFAGIIAVGVVYNAARIALSERSHELASMRVLGFTRGEISSILLGELAVVTLAAVPLGMVFGYGLVSFMVAGFDTELYRFPLVISTRSYAISALVVLLASTVSGLAVRRRLDHLDLVEVLKTKE
jgi:putative ABC transport system permease protein